MDDYIKRQAAIEEFESLPNCYNGFSDTYDKACIIGVLEEIASADVEPVRHGRWEWIGGRSWRCSECEWIHEPNKPRFQYCPICGARMDGGKRDEQP